MVGEFFAFGKPHYPYGSFGRPEGTISPRRRNETRELTPRFVSPRLRRPGQRHGDEFLDDFAVLTSLRRTTPSNPAEATT